MRWIHQNEPASIQRMDGSKKNAVEDEKVFNEEN